MSHSAPPPRPLILTLNSVLQVYTDKIAAVKAGCWVFCRVLKKSCKVGLFSFFFVGLQMSSEEAVLLSSSTIVLSETPARKLPLLLKALPAIKLSLKRNIGAAGQPSFIGHWRVNRVLTGLADYVCSTWGTAAPQCVRWGDKKKAMTRHDWVGLNDKKASGEYDGVWILP